MAEDKMFDLILNSLEKAHDKLDTLSADFSAHVAEDARMSEEQIKMNQILEKNTGSLELHIKRTELLEKSVQNLSDKVAPLEKEYLYKKAVESFFSTVGKWIGVVATVGGAIAAIFYKMF
jgi:hypothetical protein